VDLAVKNVEIDGLMKKTRRDGYDFKAVERMENINGFKIEPTISWSSYRHSRNVSGRESSRCLACFWIPGKNTRG
jgi:hypothetical protein